MNYINFIALRVKELQQSHRSEYTLRSIARRISVSHSMLSQIIRGKKIPSLHLTRRLCLELNMPSQIKEQIEAEILSLHQLNSKYFKSAENSEASSTKGALIQDNAVRGAGDLDLSADENPRRRESDHDEVLIENQVHLNTKTVIDELTTQFRRSLEAALSKKWQTSDPQCFESSNTLVYRIATRRA